MIAEVLLKLSAISKSFGGTHALRGVDFELRAGEVHGLMGENGAGKSTLIKIITGALRADSGRMEMGGRVVEENSPTLAREMGIAAIYQQPALFGELSVAENIALGLEKHGAWQWIRWGERRRRATELLDRVGANISPDREVGTLTMPEQQLVEIARALGAEARVVLMDEPTASLSEREVGHLFKVIGVLRSQGVGIIYISHRMEELKQVGDRVTVLRDGALVGTRMMKDLGRGELIRMMVGREVEMVRSERERRFGEIVLETENLGCAASGIRGVNLRIAAGEIVGLGGLVGAGRTELARILFGLTPGDMGRILLRRKAVVIDSPGRAVEMGMGYVPEDRRRHGVILEMSVAANATMAVPGEIARRGWLNFGREREVAESFVERLGIKTAGVQAAVGTLSGGNQQKVALARWLATGPRVLILDEPTQGVDVGAKGEIHRLIDELAGQGLAILLISSELPELLAMSDRIVVMHGGGVVGELPAAEATQEKVLEIALGHAEPAVGI